MLKTIKKQRQEWADTRPTSELLPWLTILTPDIVACKDGSIFGMFEMSGVDLEGKSATDIDHAAASVERSLKSLDDRFNVMWITRKQRDNTHEEVNETHDKIEQAYRQWQNGEEYYTIRDFMVISLRPPEGANRMFSPIISAISGEIGWWDSFKASFNGSTRFALTVEVLENQCETLNGAIRQITSNLPLFNIKRIFGDDLLGWLNTLASPASEHHKVGFDPDRGYLDTALGENTISVEPDHVTFYGAVHKQHMAAMTIKEWAATKENEVGTNPELLSTLLDLEAEYTLVRVFRPLSPDQSRRHVTAVRRHHVMRATPLINHLRKAMSDEKIEEQKDPSRMADANEAGEALNEINKGLTGWLSVSLLLYGDTESSLDRVVEQASKRLSFSGIVAFRESLHVLSSWAGTLPGNWDESIRYVWATGANAADLSPIVALSEGERINKHLTEQSGIEQPALIRFQTKNKTAYSFNFHHHDLAHSMVIGPSGTGKSVLMNLLLTRWQQYKDAQTYIFDKDRSCYITTHVNNGSYLDPASGNMRMNPMKDLESDTDWEWFTSWLEILLTHREKELSAKDDKALKDAVDSVRRIEKDKRRLKHLEMILPKNLAERLSPWVEGGQFARWFDNDEDSFSLDRFVTIAMDDLFNQPSVARAFLDYAFHRINHKLTGAPTVIYIEEVWFAFSDETFTRRLDNWLRTIRKKNGFIVLATQNLEELARSDAFATIVDNIPTRIFLPNINVVAHEELYKGRFQLTSAQMEIIKSATAKRDYLINKPDHSRLVQISIPDQILAYLRSDQRALNTFKKWQETEGEDYMRRYENEIAA